MGIKQKLSNLFHGAERKRREFVVEAQSYTLEHPNELMIICDLKEDVAVIAHQDLIVPIHFHKDGKRLHVIENALNYRKMNNSIDTFLLALDGALATIATTLYNRKHGTGHKLPEAVREEEGIALASSPQGQPAEEVV